MQPEPKKHVSHAIAWSLIALFAGSLAFGIWAYFNQISDIYDSSVTISFSHKKTAVTPTTTATTGSTTTDATADWKTYTNDTYGFSFKYPTDWIIAGADESSGNSFSKNLAPNGDIKKYHIEFSHTYLNYDNKTILEQFNVLKNDFSGQPSFKILKSQNGVRFSENELGNSNVDTAIFATGKYIVVFKLRQETEISTTDKSASQLVFDNLIDSVSTSN